MKLGKLESWAAVANAILVLGDVILLQNTYRKYVRGVPYKVVNCTGKVYIITGCNTGIGFETAKAIAKMEGKIIMACRTPQKAEEARQKIIADTECHPDNLVILPLDLCDFTSVREFVNKFAALNVPLHCLVNNAGVMMHNRCENAAGHEIVFTANHLSHFLLTNLLLPHLDATNGRIVVLSSALHRAPKEFDLSDVMSKKKYSLFGSYTQSKLANIMHVKELQHRLALRNSNITCNAVHPGCVRTEVTRNMSTFMRMGNAMVAPILRTMQKTPEQGAYTSVHVATSSDLVNARGEYFFHCMPAYTNPAALDLNKNNLLWELSEQITGSSVDMELKKKVQ